MNPKVYTSDDLSWMNKSEACGEWLLRCQTHEYEYVIKEYDTIIAGISICVCSAYHRMAGKYDFLLDRAVLASVKAAFGSVARGKTVCAGLNHETS